MGLHPTTQVRIKGKEVAAIDTEMVPLIVWLNSLRHVRTLYCCQGFDDAEGETNKPYVSFTCGSLKTLAFLMKATQVTYRNTRPIRATGRIFAFTDVHPDHEHGCIFCMRFHSLPWMRDFLARVTRKRKGKLP